MAHPFASIPAETTAPLQLLLAPRGQLSGDGQLHELMRERRRHEAQARGSKARGDGGLWYLPPTLCRQTFGPGDLEGVVLRNCSAALWLQLRFGGELHGVALEPDWLALKALELPPAAPHAVMERRSDS